MSFPKVTGIVLAAGQGSRMGQAKLLLPFRGSTILECVVDSALESSLDRVIVVLGHHTGDLEPQLKGRDVTVVINPLFESGQSSSLRAGLRAAGGGTGAVLFLLGDQPLITPGTINTILRAYQASPASPIVLPVFDGRRGNPVLFGRHTFSRIEKLSGDQGARSLFEEYAGHILQVPAADRSIHFDVDTEEDYRLLLEHEGR